MPTSVVLRAVLAGARLPDRFPRGARGAINGLWLGALSDARLQELDELYYDREAVYRTAEWNAHGLFEWERVAIEQHFAGARRIAIAACGGGRQVLALREAGFDAIGYEPHAALVAFAQEFLAARGHPDCVHPSPRDALPPGDPCDGVIVGWTAYSLIHGSERRIAFLRMARERLAPGGPLLVSYFERGAHGRELRLTRSLANRLRAPRRRERLELGDTLAPNRVHVFTRDQVADEARAAGLKLSSHAIVGHPRHDTDYAAGVLHAP